MGVNRKAGEKREERGEKSFHSCSLEGGGESLGKVFFISASCFVDVKGKLGPRRIRP